MRILLIGSGGREHSLAWKLKQSPKLEKLFCTPGNAGIAEEAELVSINIEDHQAVIQFCQLMNIDFVVVGPEIPWLTGWSIVWKQPISPLLGLVQRPPNWRVPRVYKDLCDNLIFQLRL